MKITVICVGKLKEKYWKSAIEEYSKRLNRYCNLKIIEIPDEPCPEKAGEELMKQIKDREAQKIEAKIPSDAYLVTLEIHGRAESSESLARWMEILPHSGYSHIAFVIGGSLGISEKLSKKSMKALSFSKMTFPHQMMRVILLEQIYRAFRINRNEPYHK